MGFVPVNAVVVLNCGASLRINKEAILVLFCAGSSLVHSMNT